MTSVQFSLLENTWLAGASPASQAYTHLPCAMRFALTQNEVNNFSLLGFAAPG